MKTILLKESASSVEKQPIFAGVMGIGKIQERKRNTDTKVVASECRAFADKFSENRPSPLFRSARLFET